MIQYAGVLLDERPLSHASVLFAAITSVACGSAWFGLLRGPETPGSGPTLLTALLFGVTQLVVSYLVAGRLRRAEGRGVRAGIETGAGIGLSCACACVGYALVGGPSPLSTALVVGGFALLSPILMGGLISGFARQRVPTSAWARRPLSPSPFLRRA